MASISRGSTVCKWQQLKAQLLGQIKRGEHRPGEVFCSQQELMSRHGVSYVTVSRALAELVREGYLSRKQGVGTFVRPNAQRQRRVGTIGLLVWDHQHMHEHPAYARLMAGMSEPLRAVGHNLSFIFVSTQLVESGALAEVVRRAHVQAVIAPAQPMLTAESLRPLVEQGLPVVPLNLDFPQVCPCAVHFDMARAIKDATGHLLACGYRDITLMVNPNEDVSLRVAGYRQALRAAGIRGESVCQAPREGPLEPLVRQVLDRATVRAGIVACDDEAALTTLRTARDAGWRVPEDLGVVGVGDFLPPEMFETPLTTVHVPFAAMGRMAAQMTLALLAGRTPTPPVRYLSPRLVVRATTGTPLSHDCEAKP